MADSFFDIVIDNKIVLELKRDTDGGSIKAAKEQVERYSIAWGNKGPVILVFCNGKIEQASVKMHEYFHTRKDQNLFAVLAKSKS